MDARSKVIESKGTQTLDIDSSRAPSKEETSKAYNVAAFRTKEVELNPVLDPPRNPTSDAETQSPCWWDIVSQGNIGGDSTEDGLNSWSEVTRRKPLAKNQGPNAGTSNKRLTGQQTADPTKVSRGEPVKSMDKPKRTRMRPTAIMVDVTSNGDLPALARRIKSGMDD